MTTRGDIDLFFDVTEERGINLQTLEQTIRLAVEIAREGREGRKIGTLFIVSDAEETSQQSTCLILDPLLGHPHERKHLDDPDMRETVKELAQLDGAFLISDNGIVLSASRYINASSEGIDLPLSPNTQTPSPSSPRRARWCVSRTTERSCPRLSLSYGCSDVTGSISKAPTPPVPVSR